MDEKTLMLLAIFLLGLIVILAVVLLALQIVNIRKNQHSIHTLSEKIIRDLEDMEDGLQEQYSRQREELMNNLHQMHSSLVNTFGNISQSYGDYIGEVLQQNDRYNQQNERNMQIIQAQIADCLKRMETQIGLLTTSNSQQLQEIRATVEEKLNATLEKRLNASFSQVSERLEQVYKSLG